MGALSALYSSAVLRYALHSLIDPLERDQGAPIKSNADYKIGKTSVQHVWEDMREFHAHLLLCWLLHVPPRVSAPRVRRFYQRFGILSGIVLQCCT